MDSVLNLIINAENVRMLVLLVFGFSCFVWLKTSLEKKIGGVESSVKELKYNDFAHLNSTIEALTYALEKNGALQKEDKAYVDSRLAH